MTTTQEQLIINFASSPLSGEIDIAQLENALAAVRRAHAADLGTDRNLHIGFWRSPVGQAMFTAYQRLAGDDLIPVTAAAEIVGISAEAMRRTIHSPTGERAPILLAWCGFNRPPKAWRGGRGRRGEVIDSAMSNVIRGWLDHHSEALSLSNSQISDRITADLGITPAEQYISRAVNERKPTDAQWYVSRREVIEKMDEIRAIRRGRKE